MRQLAGGLGLNTKATLVDLRILIEGKVEQLDHEPRNVQVKVQQTSEGVYLLLQDVQGGFLRVEPPEKVVVEDSEEQSSSSGSEDLHQVVKSVQKDNAELQSRNDELCGELDKLKEELQNIKVRVTDLWQSNCDQMREADEMIAAKDKEIAALRNQLQLLDTTRTVPGVLGATESSISWPYLTHLSVQVAV